MPYRDPGQNGWPCPRCGAALAVRHLSGTLARECPDCKGLWFAAHELNRLVIDSAEQRAILVALGDTAPPSREPTVRYLPCPDCGALMTRVNFGRTSGVIVDSCKRHGAWFDRGELTAALTFLGKRDPLS